MRGTNYCTYTRATDDPVRRSYQLFSNEGEGGLYRGYRYRSFSLSFFFFFTSSPMRKAAALLQRRTTARRCVHVNRDGLLCVDGDSRETDRNQADVTVRKVHEKLTDVRALRRRG